MHLALMELIEAEWGIHVESSTPFPLGEDARNYRAAASDGKKYVVRVQDRTRAGDLEARLRIVVGVNDGCGLRGAVAAIPTRHGNLTVSHGDTIVALFPFIAGSVIFPEPLAESQIEPAATLIASLHNCESRHLSVPFREAFDNPFAAPILRALAVDDSAGGSEYRREVVRLLQAERESILATLDRMKRMRVRLRELAYGEVITHGDPNLANIIAGADGSLYLIDWGEVALGPPERDLVHFTGPTFARFLDRYAAVRPGSRLHADLFAFYVLRWIVQEIADYTSRILFEGGSEAEMAHAWEELQPYVPIPVEAMEHQMSRIRRDLESTVY